MFFNKEKMNESTNGNSSQTITIQEEDTKSKTLRLVLKKQAEYIANHVATVPETVRICFRNMSKYFANYGIENQEEGNHEELTEKNVNKIKEQFNEWKELIEQQRIIALRELYNLPTPEQQQDVILFWEEVAKFINKFIDWINELFRESLGQIKQNKKLDTNALKNLVYQIGSCIYNGLTMYKSF